MKIYLEDVFKTSWIPTYTFVKPQEYTKLLVWLRTKWRWLIIEWPSWIGKTTSVTKAIEEVFWADWKKPLILSARKKEDLDLICDLPSMKEIWMVIIDDFHVLSAEVKKTYSDFMKTLADEESAYSKLILVWINKAGDSLIVFSPDLNNRIDTIKFEANPKAKIEEMILLWERALWIKLNIRDEIIEEAKWSFHIAQMLAKEACISSEITDSESSKKETDLSMEYIKEKVFKELWRLFYQKAKSFSVWSKLKKEWRAPYLNILNWLAFSPDWSIHIGKEISSHPTMKLSISQVIEKGYLKKLIDENDSLQDVVHYDDQSNILTIEDPKFLFYIRNIPWNQFAKEIWFMDTTFKKPYDFALSFAWESRSIAEKIFNNLSEKELSVFYDRNEQYRMVWENIEEYLWPIYRSEAECIIVIISPEYNKKIWTKFESNEFKGRFWTNSVIPIWSWITEHSLFDESRKYSWISLNVNSNEEHEICRICGVLSEKLINKRAEGSKK